MNTFGQLLRFTTWGESHGPALGVVVDGCPSGIEISEEDLQRELDRRRPGQSAVTTQRQESDKAQILSGVFRGKTTGHPICVLVRNEDAQGAKYDAIENIWRPGHADYTYDLKYGLRDHRGGGRSSAREMVGRVVAGVLAGKILSPFGTTIRAYTTQVGDIRAQKRDFAEIERNPVRCADAEAAAKMAARIEEVRREGDSIGGVVEGLAQGVPAGLGEPVYGKLDALLGFALLSINATKGVEIGNGFASARLLGSQNNDRMRPGGKGGVVFETNEAGGILGGISTGQDILCRVAIKPASSILKEQQAVDRRGQAVPLRVEGRHDPCLCPRAVPVVEAMMALVLADALLQARARGQPKL